MTTSEAQRSPERLRVLVVDDHDVVHWGFRLMLTQQPWVERCLSAQNGSEALQLAARYRPHVALVDLFIGEESGAEVCERLREAEPATRGGLWLHAVSVGEVLSARPLISELRALRQRSTHGWLPNIRRKPQCTTS